MKNKLRHCIYQLCTACAGIGFFLYYDRVSVVLFGEPTPPIEEE